MILQLLLDPVWTHGGTHVPRIHGVDQVLASIPLLLEAITKAEDKNAAQLRELGSNIKSGFDTTIAEQARLHQQTCEEIRELRAKVIQLESELKAQAELNQLQQQDGFSGFASRIARSVQHIQGTQMATLLLGVGAVMVSVFTWAKMGQIQRQISDMGRDDRMEDRRGRSNRPISRPHPERGSFDEQLEDRYPRD